MQKAQSCRITDGVADIDSVNVVLVIELLWSATDIWLTLVGKNQNV